MKTTLEQVNIVEYHEGLAKGIAKMWNESREGWGGDSVVTTEEQTKEKEANSTNLHLFLATVGEEVVGYCGLSEYKEDEGALYIPLLNVHPKYQGLKIGKKLVLKALEKTIELKWPRLDLFTWAGNTKAVPLYKKCGFFWEERDDATHLMNFIPSVLQIDMLKPFFEKHDWYSTSQRVIEVKPDGIKENDHTFYEYKWEVGEEFVRVQFERTGRGIRLIETNEFLIEMKLPNFKLLEKEEHSVSYRVVNKTNVPMNVSIKGESSTAVSHEFEHSTSVAGEWTESFPLMLSMPEREPSPWKTHPIVGASLEINGCEFHLKMGVFPKQAGKLHTRSVKKHWRANLTGTVYLDIESQLEEDSTWTIRLPENDVLSFEKSEVTAVIKEKGRVSIPLPCKLLKNDFYTEEVDVLVQRQSGERFTFTTNLSVAFPGFGARFGGESDTHWYAYNGPFYVEVEKRNHIAKVGSIHSTEEPLTLMTVKLGKPYSEEFSKKEATSVEYIELSECFVMKTSLESDTFSPLVLNTYVKLYGDGLVELKHEIVNRGTDLKENISLLQPLFLQLKGLAIPQQNSVMTGNEANIPFMDYVRDKDISERWLYTSSGDGESIGLSWPETSTGRKDDWRFGIEYHVQSLGAEEDICLGPIQIGINQATCWSQWREFVLGEEVKSLTEQPIYALESQKETNISSIDEKVDYAFRTMLTPYLDGTLTVSNKKETIVKEIRKEEEATKLNVQLGYDTSGIHSLKGQFHSAGHIGEIRTLQLVKGDKETVITNQENHWVVDNGVLTFKADGDYFPGVYSLEYNGQETLDHQYPKAGPKAWWNPWGGGIRYHFHSVSPYSMMKEETVVKSVTKKDQDGNEWTGLCLTTPFKEHETMKGIVLHQYALTLPEVPVLAVYGEVHQQSGRTFSNELLDFDAFLKPSEQLTSCFAKVPTDGVMNTYYAGVEEFALRETPYVTVGADGREELLTILHSESITLGEVYMNQEVFLVASAENWSAATGDVVKMKPTILVYGEENLHQYAQSLLAITFE